MPSLLKKVKAKLSQSYEKGKEQRQQKQVKQASLHKAVEEARWSGYRKGAVARARKEGFQQAKTKTGHGIFGTLGEVGKRANLGLDFMNQDFATAFSGKPKPQHITHPHAESGKGVTIHVHGTTIHVGKKQEKKRHNRNGLQERRNLSPISLKCSN